MHVAYNDSCSWSILAFRKSSSIQYFLVFYRTTIYLLLDLYASHGSPCWAAHTYRHANFAASAPSALQQSPGIPHIAGHRASPPPHLDIAAAHRFMSCKHLTNRNGPASTPGAYIRRQPRFQGQKHPHHSYSSRTCS